MREVGDIRVGDTIVSAGHPETEAIPGFRHPQPMVFCGLYPVSTNEYNNKIDEVFITNGGPNAGKKIA
jgi:GTP-binding protein LepA